MISSETIRRPSRSKPQWEKDIAVKRVIEGNETKAKVARELNIPESTLRGWCKSWQKRNADKSTISPTSSSCRNIPGQLEKRLKLSVDVPVPVNWNNNTNGSWTDPNCLRPIELPRTSPKGSIDKGVPTAAVFPGSHHTGFLKSPFVSRENYVPTIEPRPRISIASIASLPTSRLSPEESVREWLNRSHASPTSPDSSSHPVSSHASEIAPESYPPEGEILDLSMSGKTRKRKIQRVETEREESLAKTSPVKCEGTAVNVEAVAEHTRPRPKRSMSNLAEKLRFNVEENNNSNGMHIDDCVVLASQFLAELKKIYSFPGINASELRITESMISSFISSAQNK